MKKYRKWVLEMCGNPATTKLITQAVCDWSEVLVKLAFGKSGSHNLENKEICRGAVCYITECSIHFHALINLFYVVGLGLVLCF